MSRGYINRLYTIHKFVRSGDIIKSEISKYRNMHEAALNLSYIEKFYILLIFMMMHKYVDAKQNGVRIIGL